jgi:lipoate-protein ligase A
MDINARVIKEITNSSRRKAIYGIGKNHSFQEPVIIVLGTKSPTISIHGNAPIESYINMDKVTDDFEIIRIDSNINTGVIVTDPKTIIVKIYSGKELIYPVRSSVFKSIIEVLSSKGIVVQESSHRKGSNDIVFVKDGKEKKFFGCIMDMKENYLTFFITLNFNSSIIEGLFKLDTPKFKNRGEVNHITEVVGGLDEVYPSIDETIIDEIINSFTNKLNWSTEISSFTEDEEKLLKF